MTVATFLAHSLPLVLIAAVSPVLFLNASRVVEAAGIPAGLYFGGGAVLCLIALGVPTLGLMGATTSQLLASDLASRSVDLALALVLIAYGAWQVVRSHRHRNAAGDSSETKDHALPTGGRALFAAGLLGMITNFTTAPLSKRRSADRHRNSPVVGEGVAAGHGRDRCGDACLAPRRA